MSRELKCASSLAVSQSRKGDAITELAASITIALLTVGAGLTMGRGSSADSHGVCRWALRRTRRTYQLHRYEVQLKAFLGSDGTERFSKGHGVFRFLN